MCQCTPAMRTPFCGRPGCVFPTPVPTPVPSRQSWDDYFLQMAVNAAERATCPRLHVGAVVTRNHRVVGTGYNGSLPGEPHCDEVGCLMVDGHCIRTVHAEENAIHNAEGRGDTLYCTHYPCLHCLKTVLAAGVRRIVYLDEYRPYPARDVFVQAFTGELTLIHKQLTTP
jgi:dCMP deaminase